MNRHRGSLWTMALAATGLATLKYLGPDDVYSFGGNSRLLDNLQHGLLFALLLTHIALAFIMWTQRRRWDGAEAAIFRFIAIKAIFWGYLAATFSSRPVIMLEDVFLLAIMLAATIDLDVQLLRRYVLVHRDDPADPA